MNAWRGNDNRRWLCIGAAAVALGIASITPTPARADDAPRDVAPAAPAEPAEGQPQPLPRPPQAEDEADANADAEAAEPAAIDDDELLDAFRVLPQSFSVNSNLHFDDEGNIRNENHNMSLSLNFFYGLAHPPRSYRNFTIDQLITDAGEELNVQHHMSGEQIIHHHHHGNQAPRFNINFQVSRPTQPASRVRRLVGSVEVAVPVGEPRHAVLSPIEDVLGKRVHIANYPGSDLQITQEAHHSRLRIQMNGELAAVLTDVRFFHADDREIPAQSRGRGRSGDQHQQYYQSDLPDDGKIMLTFLSERRMLRVPFELEDIPLPQPDNAGGADLVIRAEAGDPIARNAGPGDGDLEVRIE